MINNYLFFIIILIIIIISSLFIIISYYYNIGPQLYESGKDRIISILSVKPEEIKVPKRKVDYKGKKYTFPFIAGVPIKIGKIEYIFVGGNKDEPDKLLKYNNKRMIDIISTTGIIKKKKSKWRNFLPATYGGVSIDLNNNGMSDLIVARDDGVTLYTQYKQGKFKSKKIFEEQQHAIPVALAVSDYNKDGNLDIFVSNFIHSDEYKDFVFNNLNHSKANVLLKNNNGNFKEDKTKSKIGRSGNTFTDVNNNSWPDLVVTQDVGQIEIWKNNFGKFEKTKFNSGFGFWMGLSVGDINNDDKMDVFSTNVGNNINKNITKGNSKKKQPIIHDHLLLLNNGDFKFRKLRIKDKSFGWGPVMQDINLDGQNDIAFSANYILNPFHSIFPQINPVLYVEGTDPLKYKKVKSFPNFGFGDNILLVDLNNNGLNEIVWVNMVGPMKIFSDTNIDNNNYLNIVVPDNKSFTNARVKLILSDDSILTKENIYGGTGLGSDISNTMQFGIGKDKHVKSVFIKTIYGKIYFYINPKKNSTLLVRPLRS